MSVFADLLKHYRAELGISQRELCQQLYGVPRRTLEDWESGKSEPAAYVRELILARLSRLALCKGQDEKDVY